MDPGSRGACDSDQLNQAGDWGSISCDILFLVCPKQNAKQKQVSELYPTIEFCIYIYISMILSQMNGDLTMKSGYLSNKNGDIFWGYNEM